MEKEDNSKLLYKSTRQGHSEVRSRGKK